MKLEKHIVGMQNHKKLFTVVFEYDKGTFISQFKIEELKDLLLKWTYDLLTQKIINYLDYENLSSELKEEDNGLIEVKGLRNIWTTSVNLSKGFALINIISTSNK